MSSEVLSSSRRVQRVRHELKRRDVTVCRVTSVSPGFRSIDFTGGALADFVSASFDDHVKVIIDAGDADPVRRDYTPRAFDQAARQLTIEFSLHGDGPAATWARTARPGQHVTIGGPRGSMIIPVDYEWHLLIGDETALPAMSRRMDELPADAQVRIIGQVAALADRRAFAGLATPVVDWVSTDAELIDAARSITLPPGEGYVWCAGESATMQTLRAILVHEKGHDRHAIRAAAYWKRGEAAHHENLDD